jgi:hypothetical protein
MAWYLFYRLGGVTVMPEVAGSMFRIVDAKPAEGDRHAVEPVSEL